MDNAPIHKQNELKQLFDANDHILFFAPSYSAEMNPIEFLFSSWKCKADMMLKGRELNERVIRNAIEASFRDITPISIRSLVHHVVERVYPKVFNGDTI